jgi:hypothetical protein
MVTKPTNAHERLRVSYIISIVASYMFRPLLYVHPEVKEISVYMRL